jgi:hypothetical protein
LETTNVAVSRASPIVVERKYDRDDGHDDHADDDPVADH